MALVIPILCMVALVLVYNDYMFTPHLTLPLNKTVKERGIVVLAHGSAPRWNNAVIQAAMPLAQKYPTVVAFGMADPKSIQDAVDKLESLGVEKIIFVPLYISSHSELYRQTEYVLGMLSDPDPDFVEGMHYMMKHPVAFLWNKVPLRDLPIALAMVWSHGHMDMTRKVVHHVPIELRRALDSSHLVGELLAERAQAQSTHMENETVLIVGHGPVNEQDNDLWLHEMEKLASLVKEKYPFRDVCVATMRDDAPDGTKDVALEYMRKTVRECAAQGQRVIVVPLLLAQGGVEKEIHHILNGLTFTYDERTLLPHANISSWLVETAETATAPVSVEPEFAPVVSPIVLDKTRAVHAHRAHE